MEVTELVAQARRRLRLGGALSGVAAGLVAIAASIAVSGLAWNRPALGGVIGGVAAALVVLDASRRATLRWTSANTAAYIESRVPGLDNLVVTATDLGAGAIEASDWMRAEILRQASDRVEGLRLPAVAPIAGPLWLLALAALGALAVIGTARVAGPGPAPTLVSTPDVPRLQTLRVTITPPPYLDRAAEQAENPEQVVVPAGGRLRIEVRATAPFAWIEEPGAAPRPMSGPGGDRLAIEWAPDRTTALAVSVGEAVAAPVESRLLRVVVAPDEAPRVRIMEPGRDLAFPAATATLDLTVEATDAEGLAAVRIVYVRASGSGESFAFEEGQVPVGLERIDARNWRGRARLPLAALQLEDGDSLVYRALVRDSNPEGEWVSSDAFTVDIGRRLEFAGAGFAVPDEDRRYAISQQMVIVKTERLHAERERLSPDEWNEQTRLLAMEQRMVRAEVVFLSGGEVADEVEEAEQSHELQEGRLENAGRAEMLKAINEMSRAEAHLNGGDTTRALLAERTALAALQRAFDRRRYFLRTMSERARIDTTRRLTGDRARAQSSTRQLRPDPGAEAADLRRLLQDLASVAEGGEPASVALLTRLASVDSTSEEWRRMAAALAAAPTGERQEAARTAMARVAEYGRARSGQSAPAPVLSALSGWWADERSEGRRP